jgi:hypothetical protein
MEQNVINKDSGLCMLVLRSEARIEPIELSVHHGPNVLAIVQHNARNLRVVAEFLVHLVNSLNLRYR